MGEFVLGSFARKDLTGEPLKPENKNVLPKEWLGHCLVAAPLEAHTVIDFTGPPGSVSGIYYSLMFQLRKWEYQVQKADEFIEVSPVHAQYYNLTHKQKEDLEGRIKSGLQSVSQSVADYELIFHDKRKYEEFLRYMGYRTPLETPNQHKDHKHAENSTELCLEVDSDEKSRKQRESLIDNHSLKAIFIDQVDVHTGDGISIKSIVSRWPTLIIDFMKMSDNDMDVDKVSSALDISKAEAVVLITKNKLYQEWKRLFMDNLKGRYFRITELLKARESSMKEYKEWLKPLIARHKLINEGLSSESNRKSTLTSFITAGGQAVSSSHLEIWVWKDFTPPEFFKAGSELNARQFMGKPHEWKLTPYDDWTKKNLIFHKKNGLVRDYNWITDDWCKKQMQSFYDGGWLVPRKLYYSFFIVSIDRTNMKSPTGEELEDGMFDVNMVVMSQNAMLAKLLELRAKQHEFEQYVSSLVGMPERVEGKPVKIDKKDSPLKPVQNFFNWFSLDFRFMKRGPYEKDFEDRITKYYLAPIAGDRYGAIVGFIKSKIGMGK
jgi:hypothetical protein